MKVLIDDKLYVEAGVVVNDFDKTYTQQIRLRDLNIKIEYLKQHQEKYPEESSHDLMERDPFYKYFWEKNEKEIRQWEQEYGQKISE